MAKAIQFFRSVPRWLLVRALSGRFASIATGPLSCIALADIDPPALPSPEWVRIRPRLSGICGSDLATIGCRSSPYFSPFVSTPFVLGHEIVGDIVETGTAVPRRWTTGVRVVLEPALTCRVRGIHPGCPNCLAGHSENCECILRGNIQAGIQTGYCRSTAGGWSAATLVAHYSQLHQVPSALSDDEAVLAEPFACALHGVLKAPLDSKATVLVLGCGTIGLLAIHAYRCAGGKGMVLAVSRHAHQAAMAQQLGADECITGHSGTALYQWLLEWTDHPMERGRLFQPEIGKPVVLGGAGIVLDCVGSSQSLDDALRLARPGGQVILLGMPGIAVGVDWTSAWYKQLKIEGSYAFSWETLPDMQRIRTMELALQFLAGHAGMLKPLITHHYSLEEYRTALDQAFHIGRSGSFKTVFAIS